VPFVPLSNQPFFPRLMRKHIWYALTVAVWRRLIDNKALMQLLASGVERWQRIQP